MLGGLPTDQCAAGRDTCLGDPFDDLRDPFGDDSAAGDVVGQEQRLSAADDEVVDDHADQVEPDRVVDVHPLRDRDLRADAVGGRREQRAAHAAEGDRVEQPGEPTQAADDLRTGGLRHPLLHELDRALPGVDVDACGGVRAPRRPRRWVWLARRRGHGRQSASEAPRHRPGSVACRRTPGRGRERSAPRSPPAGTCSRSVGSGSAIG